MNCLIDSVGLIGCGGVAPASGLTVNQIPGISLKSIEKTANEEQRDYLGVWNDVQIRASKRFPIDVAAKLGVRFKLNSIPTSIDLGRIVDTATVTSSAPEYRGGLFDLNKYEDQGVNGYKHSALQSHYFQSIVFYSPIIQAGTIFKVFDYETNSTIETVTKDVSIGWNVVASTKEYTKSKIAVIVDSTNIDTVTLQTPNSLEWCSSCCGASVEGITWAISDDISNAETSNNTHGISVIYGTRCKFDNLVCNNIDKFVLAWQYLLGIELTIEQIYSKRINKWALPKSEGEELKAYLDIEYNRILTQVCDSININTSDCCIECDAVYNTIESNLH